MIELKKLSPRMRDKLHSRVSIVITLFPLSKNSAASYDSSNSKGYIINYLIKKIAIIVFPYMICIVVKSFLRIQSITYERLTMMLM